MRKFVLFLALLMAMPLAASFATAATHFTVPGFKRIAVRANRTTRVSYHAQYNGTCQRRYRTSIIITTRPRHGQLRVRKRVRRLPRNHPEFRCRGKRIWTYSVYYRPDRGYRGRDSFGYVVTGLSSDPRVGSRYFGVRVR
ncbi:MAG: hypothetical protein L3J67_04010 [Hyphomicrobiaceae bacterium]|nr:hypothetical protein [Hyphomicrobiaceae bacterium]